MNNELNKQLNDLLSKRINKITIAGNTIELWVECEPRSENAQKFWIDPPWRIERDNNIVATSAYFPWEREAEETKEEYRSRFDKECKKCHVLHGAEIETLSYSVQNADIEFKFKNGYILRSFTVWDKEESWHYTNKINKVRYYVSANEIEIKNLA